MSCNRARAFAASLALATGFALPSFAQDVDPEQIATTHRQMTATRFKPVLAAEGRSQAKCEGAPNRIFVMTAAGSECIAYFVTRGFEARREAVLFFGGDAISADETWQQENLEANERMLQIWADQFKVRYVFVSRVGMQGSSGNHAERRFPKETIVMNAVTDGLKTRLGLDKLALAGHSGGSTIAASLLTMGRSDVTCAVLGSAPLELADQQYDAATKLGFKEVKEAISANVYDPSTHVGLDRAKCGTSNLRARRSSGHSGPIQIPDALCRSPQLGWPSWYRRCSRRNRGRSSQRQLVHIACGRRVPQQSARRKDCLSRHAGDNRFDYKVDVAAVNIEQP